MREQRGRREVAQVKPVRLLQHKSTRALAVGIDLIIAVADRADVGISGQLLERLRQFVLCPPIVAVKERSDLPVHLGDADIERRGLAAVGFEKVPHPGSEFANNC